MPALYNSCLGRHKVRYEVAWRRVLAHERRQTLPILPISRIVFKLSEFLQQIAVGDRDGVVQVFSTKKGELGFNFKTLPGKAITRLELGGALGK